MLKHTEEGHCIEVLKMTLRPHHARVLKDRGKALKHFVRALNMQRMELFIPSGNAIFLCKNHLVFNVGIIMMKA